MALRLDRATWWLIALLCLPVALVELGAIQPVHPGAAARTSHRTQPRRSSASGELQTIVHAIRTQPRAGIADRRDAAVVEGVVLGRTQRVDRRDKDAFLRSGLWHVLAASGTNVGLVAALCVLAAGICGAGRTGGTAWAMVAVASYAVVVGGGASILRATIMGEIALVAWLVGRSTDAWRALLISAVVLCWATPGVYRQLGFQLSFACVAGLLVWAAPLSRWMTSLRVPAALAGAGAATGICSIVTAPILMYTVGASPLLGSVANIVAVPLAAAMLVIGLPSTVIAVVWAPLGHPGLMVCGWLGHLLRLVATWSSALPYAQTSSPIIGYGVPLTAAGVAAARSAIGRAWLARPRHRVIAGVVVLAAATSAWMVRPQSLPPPRPGTVRIAVLDVGQGMAALIQTSQHAVLVDAGPPGAPVVELLRRARIRELDGVVVSHDSRDHRGGVPAVARAFHPGWLVMPRHAAGRWQPTRQLFGSVTAVCAGDVVSIDDGVHLRIYNPPCDDAQPDVTGDVHNDNAMVVVVEVGATRIALPADCEGSVTARLGMGPLDVLEVAHHGSEDRGLPQLLEQTRPGEAAISVGAGNSYGHPSPTSLAALREAGVPFYRTDRVGTIAYESDGTAIRQVSWPA